MTAAPNLYDILHARGFISQASDEDARARLATPTAAYIGFDPTADSLHVGSLVPIMGLYWLQQCGHRPLVVVGGATALVGDPSGKNAMRAMLSREEIAANATAISRQIGRLVRFGDDPTGAVLLNNADWLGDLNWIDLLRQVGPHFSVNRMLTLDSVKNRIDNGGITFLEFNYMIMQAYDFLHLHDKFGCTLQMGGQDQWGNIIMGVELVRRVTAAAHEGKAPEKSGPGVHGLTFPLVTKADGGKFGKSEKGNIWLSAERTPVYEFFQFWRNVADADVRKFLGFFTILPMSEVDSLASAHGAGINHAKEVLAYEVTKLIHGQEAADKVRNDINDAKKNNDVSGESIPHAELDAAELAGGVSLPALVVRSGLAATTSEARRLIQGGGVKVHDTVVSDIAYMVGTGDNQGGVVVLRAGKKRLFRFDVV